MVSCLRRPTEAGCNLPLLPLHRRSRGDGNPTIYRNHAVDRDHLRILRCRLGSLQDSTDTVTDTPNRLAHKKVVQSLVLPKDDYVMSRRKS